jgi:MFS family permease
MLAEQFHLFFLFLDKLGRRFILILGAIIMIISMFTIAIIMVTCDGHSQNSTIRNSENFLVTEEASYAIMVFIFIFVGGFAFS